MIRKGKIHQGKMILTDIKIRASEKFAGTMQRFAYGLLLDENNEPTRGFVFVPPILMSNYDISENDVGSEYDITYQDAEEGTDKNPRVLTIKYIPIKSTQFKG